jgi:hypothetical protein
MDNLVLDAQYVLNSLSSLISSKVDPHSIEIDTNVPRLSKAELAALVRKSKLLQRLIYSYGKSAYSNDFHLNIEAGSFDNDNLKNYLDSIPVYTEVCRDHVYDYGILSALRFADGLARKFGTAYIVVGYNDGLDLKEPLNTRRVKGIDWFYVYESERLIPLYYHKSYSTKGGSFKTPGGTEIHESRVYTLPGIEIDNYEDFVNNTYRHDSILTGLIEAICYWKISLQSVSDMIESASIYAMGIADLGTKIRQDNETKSVYNSSYIQSRGALLARSKSVSKLWMFDMNNESLDSIERSFIGIDANIEKLKDFFASNCDMPRFKLFNEFGTSGFSTSIDAARILNFEWQTLTNEYAKEKWLPFIDQVLTNISATFNIPEAYQSRDIIFHFGLKYNDIEKIEIANSIMDYYIKLLDREIISVEEVKTSLQNTEFYHIAENF